MAAAYRTIGEITASFARTAPLPSAACIISAVIGSNAHAAAVSKSAVTAARSILSRSDAASCQRERGINTINIRYADLQDSPALFSLTRAFATSFTVNQAAFERTFIELLSQQNALLLVSEQDGEVIGYLLGFEHPTFFANGRVAWVEELMVGEAFRQQGIGRALMEAFEEWAKQREVKLATLATRRASEFYARLGYEESAAYFRKRL